MKRKKGRTVTAALAAVTLISGCTQVLDNVGMPPDSSLVSQVTQQLNQVIVNWSDDSKSSEGYTVERRVNGGDWEILAEVGPEARQYVDATPSKSGTYQYRVKSANRHGETMSLDETVVYDGIKGKTVSAVELPVDTNGDGTKDSYQQFTLVDTDGDGEYDGIDIDGKLSTAEYTITPGDTPGTYNVDTNGDGEPDFVYDVAAGGTETYEPALKDVGGGGEAALISGGEGEPPTGIAVGGRIDPRASDVLANALSKEGTTFPWPSNGVDEPDITATVIDAYPPKPGSVDLDGDGEADAWIIGHTEDENGMYSYEIDASGNGSGDFWLNGSPYVQGSSEPHKGGEEIFPAFDQGGGLTGFGPVGEDGEVRKDNSLTDPLAGGGDGDPNGQSFEVPMGGGSGGSAAGDSGSVTLAGMPTGDGDGDGNPDPPSYTDDPASGLDTDGDGEADINIGGTDESGVYGIDVNSDGKPELYMLTFPRVRFAENKDGSGAQYQIIDDGKDVAGFDEIADAGDEIDRGFDENAGDNGLNLPDTGMATLSISSNHDDADNDGAIDAGDEIELTASLNKGSAKRWVWTVNGHPVATTGSAGSSSYTIDLDNTKDVDGKAVTLTEKQVHRITVEAVEVSGSGLVAGQDVSESFSFLLRK